VFRWWQEEDQEDLGPTRRKWELLILSVNFAINHMVAPQLALDDFFALAQALGVTRVEIRNDIAGAAIADGTPPADIRALAAVHGQTIVSINALQRFNHWSETRRTEAQALIDYAAECGAEALVLVAANDGAEPDHTVRIADATEALRQLAPMLRRAGLIGLVECLGFETCSLRSKREAVTAIVASGDSDVLRLTHDSFHHHLAGEPELFPQWTGLIHISGVDDSEVSIAGMRDSHRVLVGPGDRLDTLGQLVALRAGGYTGPISFEPFAEELRNLADPVAAIGSSMQFVADGLKTRAA
jgi:2-keto-myo-inositol isomerase